MAWPAARPSRRHAGTVVRAAASPVTEEAEGLDSVAQEKRDIQAMLNRPYKYGFSTIIESDTFPKGLDEDVVRAISAKKQEPEWMLEFRLRAFRKWLTMEDPRQALSCRPVCGSQTPHAPHIVTVRLAGPDLLSCDTASTAALTHVRMGRS